MLLHLLQQLERTILSEIYEFLFFFESGKPLTFTAIGFHCINLIKSFHHYVKYKLQDLF